MEFLSTTVLGLEDLAAREIEKHGGKIRKIEKGKIIYEGDNSLIYKLNYSAKRIFRVTILLGKGEIEKLDDVRKIVRDADFCINSTFAVRTTRKGEHNFTSMDVNAVVGEEILKKCPDSKVNLDDPNITFLCWVNDKEFLFTMDTTGESLHRRGYRKYQHPAPINPVLASLMLSLGGWNGETLVDPFCGSGTILIEAYHNYNRVPNHFRDFAFKLLPIYDDELWHSLKEKIDSKIKKRNLELIGIEKFKKHIKGCKQNLQNARVKANCILGDAENMHSYIKHTEYIVTNPPFGLRIGSKKKIFKLYEKFAEELETHFKGTTFVLIIPYTKFENYFKVLEKRDIMYGDLHTKIYKLKI